jgi:hypothetical protein
MNTKAAIGLVAAVIIFVGAFFLFNRHVEAPVVLTQTASSTAATSSASALPTITPLPGIQVAPSAGTHGPTIRAGTPTPIKQVIHVDASSLTSSASRPLITGTANIPNIGFILYSPEGVGMAGSSHVEVTNGHWSFAAPQLLSPGTYTLDLIGGDATLTVKLTVTAS